MKRNIIISALSLVLLASLCLGFAGCSLGPVQLVKEVTLPEAYLIAYQSLQVDEETLKPSTWRYGQDAQGNMLYEEYLIVSPEEYKNQVFLKEEDGTYKEYAHVGFWQEQNPGNYLTKGMIELRLSTQLYNMNNRIYKASMQYGGISKKAKGENTTIAGIECETYTVTTTTKSSSASYKEKDVYKVAFDPETGVCMRYEHVSTQRVNVDSEPTPVGSGYICTELTLNPDSFANIVSGS